MVRSLQVVQNKAARVVARLSIFTPTKTLMLTFGWLSVRQLLVYHSLVLLYRTLANHKPDYLYRKIRSGGDFIYRTRQAANGTIRKRPGSTLDLSRQSWDWKSIEVYNTLPQSLRSEKKLTNFKKRLKDWIKKNVETLS